MRHRSEPRTLWWLLLIGAVPVAMAVVAGGLIWFNVYAFMIAPVTAVKIAIGVVPTVAVLVRGLWMLVAKVDGPIHGVPVREVDQPELWALVRELAAAAGTAPPHEIRLTADANASVIEDTRVFGLIATRRRLFIGAPLVAALSTVQLAAVLTHELAHYGNHDTRFAGVAYRSRLAFTRTLATVNRDDYLQRALHFALRHYGLLVLRASAGVSRWQERAADEAAARAVGSAATVAALRELAPIARSWAVFREEHLLTGWGAGYLPADAFAGYGRLRAALHHEFEVLRADPPNEAEPYDTHPPMSERIGAVAALAAAGRVRVPSGTALGLLRDPAPLLDSALLDALGPEARAKRRADWRTLIRNGAMASLTVNTGRVLANASLVTGRPASLHALLDALDAGRLAELGADPAVEAGGADGPRVRRERARLFVHKGLTGAVVLALDHAGAVHWSESWPTTGVMRLDERIPETLSELIDAAVAEPPRTSRLRALLDSIRQPDERSKHHGALLEDEIPRAHGDAQGRQEPWHVALEVHGRGDPAGDDHADPRGRSERQPGRDRARTA